jgi:hypothetical protein
LNIRTKIELICLCSYVIPELKTAEINDGTEIQSPLYLRLYNYVRKQNMCDLCCFSILLQLVAFILIGVAVYGRASAVVTDLPIIGGILACGVFLILISILGLIGAIKHHQVVLFFVSL